METRAPYVAVGAFVLLLLAGIVVAALWFAQAQFHENFSYYDIFLTGSVTGLSKGSTVRYNGIPVGKITEIRLDPQDPTQVRVTVELEGGTPIKEDTVAQLEQQGLTGGAFINLTGGSRESPELTRQGEERYPVIQSRISSLEQVVTTAPEVLARLVTLADELGDVLNDKNRAAMAQTLANLERFTNTVASHSDQLDQAFDDGAASFASLRQTLRAANDILASLNEMMGPSGDMAKSIRAVGNAAQQIGTVAGQADAVVAENRPQLRQFTAEGLASFERLVGEWEDVAAQMKRIADAVERDPARFIYGDRREGYQPK